jgi:hypothetical protein
MGDMTNEMPELTPENIYPASQSRSGARLLIEPFKQATETSEGLLMSEGDGHATPVYGRVKRASEGATYKEGDAVLFRRYAIDSLKAYTAEGDKEIYLLEETEVIGIVRGRVEPRERQSNMTQIDQLKTNGKEKEGSSEEAGEEGGKEDRQDRPLRR